MDTKLIGGILLIVGTAIGAGMLALPIAAAEVGFWHSTILLLISWFIMTSAALLILEVNLWLPRDSNIVAMARSTLGRGGEIVAWLMYFLLFYSLIAAYIAGGGDLLSGIIAEAHVHTPQWLSTLIFTVVFSLIVYQGIRTVDYVNRGLMFSKFAAFIVLVVLVLAFISLKNLNMSGPVYTTTTFTVMLTSFGFSNIIPSLRGYFNDDAKKLRKVVLIGSLIPLICYILWNMAIMGVVPRNGQNGLLIALQSGHSTSDLLAEISLILKNPIITLLAHIFSSICILTSFMGVSLSLFDFLSDGLGVPKKGKGKWFLYVATFLPPVLIVLIDPRIFITALSYAGIYCLILLVLLPTLMAWRGRYYQTYKSRYQVKGGKTLLVFLVIAALVVVVNSVGQMFHLFPTF